MPEPADQAEVPTPDGPAPGLAGPALALLAVGLLGVAVNAFQIYLGRGGAEGLRERIPAVLQWLAPPPEGEGVVTPESVRKATQIAYAFLGVSALTCCGAVAMLSRRLLPLAIAGVFAGVVNLNGLCCALGVPVGLWCLVALNHPANRARFHRA
jgi:hypothetical protein